MISPIQVSIIVPVFNAEKYIQRCIISLIQQDLSQDRYEILIINDGSTDDTYSILRKLSQEYTHIHIITIPNQGVSAARNLGIDIAKGEIILFVDADDYITTNSLSLIYNSMKEDKLDILLFDYNYWSNQGERLKEFDHRARTNWSQDVISGKSFIETDSLPSTVWTLAYRRVYIQEMNLRFINIRHEDEEFIPRAFYFAKRVRHLKSTVYNYIQSDISFIQNYKETGLFDRIKAMESLKLFGKESIKEKNIRLALNKHISLLLMVNLKNSYIIGSKAQSKMIKQMKQNSLDPTLYKNKKIYQLLYKYFPHLFIIYFRHRYMRHRHRY
jgi:glycosyltransferase involved in cell wall biosynthesis